MFFTHMHTLCLQEAQATVAVLSQTGDSGVQKNPVIVIYGYIFNRP